MGKRLLPFRQYNEHDVINMFALEDASVNENITGFGSGDAGVFVKVSAGNLVLIPLHTDQIHILEKLIIHSLDQMHIHPYLSKSLLQLLVISNL